MPGDRAGPRLWGLEPWPGMAPRAPTVPRVQGKHGDCRARGSLLCLLPHGTVEKHARTPPQHWSPLPTSDASPGSPERTRAGEDPGSGGQSCRGRPAHLRGAHLRDTPHSTPAAAVCHRGRPRAVCREDRLTAADCGRRPLTARHGPAETQHPHATRVSPGATGMAPRSKHPAHSL